MQQDFNLVRFLLAQENDYVGALQELRLGKKRTHWIWYIFPQLKGLGRSAMAETYGITGLDEARAYLAHPILGARLKESIEAMESQYSDDATSVLGELDALKLKSCLTLFSCVAPSEKIFKHAIDRFFSGKLDAVTLALISNIPQAYRE
ncbi:MAG: DUF1810 domain-containing protein [Cellvibrio sp.]|uniref:DUF1810 domain-containing protein n=1 Tax=Cellvibrio sp. TaxID=1965322 RepID=UPI0031A3C361